MGLTVKMMCSCDQPGCTQAKVFNADVAEMGRELPLPRGWKGTQEIAGANVQRVLVFCPKHQRPELPKQKATKPAPKPSPKPKPDPDYMQRPQPQTGTFDNGAPKFGPGDVFGSSGYTEEAEIELRKAHALQMAADSGQAKPEVDVKAAVDVVSQSKVPTEPPPAEEPATPSPKGGIGPLETPVPFRKRGKGGKFK